VGLQHRATALFIVLTTRVASVPAAPLDVLLKIQNCFRILLNFDLVLSRDHSLRLRRDHVPGLAGTNYLVLFLALVTSQVSGHLLAMPHASLTHP